MSTLALVQRVIEYVRIARLAIKLAESDLGWSVKYDLIFSEEVCRALPKLDYYDPDADYEDDVRAYIRALETKLEEWERILEIAEELDGSNRSLDRLANKVKGAL